MNRAPPGGMCATAWTVRSRRSYNEADALFLVTRSETPRAIALVKEMIAVYMAARRGLLPVAASALDAETRAGHHAGHAMSSRHSPSG